MKARYYIFAKVYLHRKSDRVIAVRDIFTGGYLISSEILDVSNGKWERIGQHEHPVPSKGLIKLMEDSKTYDLIGDY